MKKYISCMLLLTLFSLMLYTSCASNGTTYPISEKNTTSDFPSFDEYMDTLFRQEVTSSTLNLHYILKNPAAYGITFYPVTLGDYSIDSMKQDLVTQENILSILKTYDYSTLSRDQQLTYDVITDSVALSMSLDDSYLYQEILNPLTGTQAQLPVLLAEYKFNSVKDVEDYLILLSQVDELFDSILSLEQRKANAGLFMADYAANDVIAQCSAFCENPDSHYLITTFNTKLESLEGLSPETLQHYKTANSDTVEDEIIPAYQNMVTELTALLGSGDNEGGLCNYKNGKAYYELLVRQETGSDKSVIELEQLTDTQRSADLSAITSALTANPALATAADNLTLALSDPTTILDDLQGKMSSQFPAIPAASYSVKYIDPSLEAYLSPAFYLTAPLDDPNENTIYINQSSGYQDLKLYTTLAHEGYPGHMYQTILSQSAGLPAIRSLLNFSGYTEGWATYVEMLSYAYADIDPAVASVLQHNQSVILSLYATCDMKIHHDGWTLADVSTFLADYGITDSDSICDMYHLIVETPANYLSYYIGYLEFLELKEKYKEKAGDAYSDISFHQWVLELGSAPFYILDDYLLTP